MPLGARKKIGTRFSRIPFSEHRLHKAAITKMGTINQRAYKTKRLDLRKKADFEKWKKHVMEEGKRAGKNPRTSSLKELAELAQHSERKMIKGCQVFFVKEFSHPENKQSPALTGFGSIFIEKNVPKEFQKILIDHEIREIILHYAATCRAVKIKTLAKRVHAIAVLKEKRDLKARGLLNKFLEWLKTNYPKAYEERIKAWKIKPD